MYLNSVTINEAVRAYRLALYADVRDGVSAPDPAPFCPPEGISLEDFCWLCRTGLMKHRPMPDVHGIVSDRLSCEMHVFFIHIWETEEQLEILRKPEPAARSTIAKSKISTTNLAEITPVDRVAARVVDVPNNERFYGQDIQLPRTEGYSHLPPPPEALWFRR